jgi:polyisoprenyl-teichoic acid--peptidoglycan teichoic acid transferase
MVSRAEEASFPVRPSRTRARARARTIGLTRTQRFLFVMALVTFGLSSTYTSVALLARVTPALFPGKSLTNLVGNFQVLAPLQPLTFGISAPDDNSSFNKRINLLVMGVDQRPLGPNADQLPDEVRWGARTDTLMIATIDPVTKTMSFLGFPRDMVIDVHLPDGSTYQDRVNASFVTGLNAGKTADAGAAQLEKDMKLNFGIDINYYLLMDFTGVEKLVDAVGGIDINVPDDLSIPGWYYSDDDVHGVYVNFPPGKQHVDGYHAVAFGRNRDPSDMARVKRQQVVLKAALQKVFSEGLLSPDTWPGLWDAYQSTIKTDIPYAKMAGYALLMQATNGRANYFSVGDPVDGQPTVWGAMLGDASVLDWNPDNVQYWLSQTFTKAAYSQSTVEIQNGYGDGGAARTASLGRYLAYSKGLPTVNYGPDQPVQQATTITLYAEPKRVLAEDIAKWLNIPKEQIKTASKGDDATLPDVVIVVGRNYKIPGN